MHIVAAFLLIAQSLVGGGLPIDGITCDREEGAVEHVHTDLQIFDRGKAVQVPANVGMPAAAQCLYWLHTHDASGIVHIESPVKRTFTLGQFFDVWGQDLSWTHAAAATAPHSQHLSIWVNGAPWHGSDPRSIVLRDHETIVIQSGPPFAKPAHVDWSKY